MNPLTSHNFANDPDLVPSTLVYELKYRKEGYTYYNQPDVDEWGFLTQWVRDPSIDAKNPDVPPNMPDIPVRGTYEEISALAVRYNTVQQQSGFIGYLFFPERITPETA